jgi:hypothetical protein
MVLIEEYPCENGLLARARERHWYEELHASLNMCRPLVHREETLADNRKKQIARNAKFRQNRPTYHKEWFANHPDYMKERYREKRSDPICFNESTKRTKIQHPYRTLYSTN